MQSGELRTLREEIEADLLGRFSKAMPIWDTAMLRGAIRQELLKRGVWSSEANYVVTLAVRRLKRLNKITPVTYEGQPKKGEHYLARVDVFSALAAAGQ